MGHRVVGTASLSGGHTETEALPEPTAQELSEVLDSIYDAALDPDAWPRALQRAGTFLACGCGIIASVDALHLDSSPVFHWGYEERFLQSLSETAKANGLLRKSLRRDVCEVIAGRDVVEFQQYAASEAYERWAKPQGIVDVLQTILDRTATSVVVAGFSRLEHQGAADAQGRKRLTLLAPHLRRAFLIGKTIDMQRLRAAALAEAMDGLAAGIFLVDDEMHLIHANASAQALLSRGVLQAAGGVLRAPDGKAARMLGASVAAAARRAIDLPLDRTMIPLGGSQEGFAAYVLPLGTGRRHMPGRAQPAAAAVFVRGTAIAYPAPVQAISQMYRLTPAESRVLLLILEIRGVPAVAAILGLAEATVKTHLRSIFRKTGTASQAGLVELAAGHQSPLAAAFSPARQTA